jgi:hypothetical protein
MVHALSKHLRVVSDDDEHVDGEHDEMYDNREIDPRWSELKKILDNN